MTSPNSAAASVAALISNYCGRDPGSGQLRACAHDHSGDGQALTDSIRRELLIELQEGLNPGTGDDIIIAERVRDELAKLPAPEVSAR
jgi:hypothetical protein